MKRPAACSKRGFPTWIFPNAILASTEYLAEIERGLTRLREKPTLVVWGDADRGFKTPERKRLLRYFPNNRIHILPGAKHFIQDEYTGRNLRSHPWVGDFLKNQDFVHFTKPHLTAEKTMPAATRVSIGRNVVSGFPPAYWSWCAIVHGPGPTLRSKRLTD